MEKISTLGELIVRVGADTRNLVGGLNDSTRQLNRWNQQAERGIGGIMDSIGRGMLIVGSAAATGFGAAMFAGTKLNANLEQSKVAFTTMLGSAEKADAFLKEMRDFAAHTPFEFTELQTAAKKMLAFGFAAEQVKPMLTSIGNAVAGLGGGQEMIDRVTVAIGQMQAKGKVSAQEMNQLAENGIPGWQMIADKMGLTTAEVMKLSEKGLIPADQAIKALTEGMDKRFGGMMEKQSKTMLGLFSTLKDMAAEYLTDVFGPTFETLKVKLDGLMAKLDEMKKNGTLQEWADSAKKAISVFWNVAEVVFKGIVGAGKFIYDNWNLIGPILAGVLAGFLAFRVATGVIKGITLATKVMNMTWKVNPIGMVTMLIMGLVTAGVYLYKNWDTVKAKAQELWRSIGDVWDNIKNKITEVVNGIKTWFDNLSTPVKVAMEAIAGVITGLMLPSMIKWSVTTSVEAVKIIASWVAIKLEAIATGAVHAAQVVPGIIAGWAAMAISAAKEGARIVAQWVLIGVRSLLSAAKMAAAWVIAMGPIAWVTAIIVSLAAVIIANWDTVKAKTSEIWKSITGFIGKTWESIKKTAETVWNGIKEFFKKWGTDLLLIATGPAGWAVLLAQKLGVNWDKIKQTALNVWNSVKTGISSIWTSITGGISSAVGSVASRVKSGMESAWSYIKSVPSQALQWGKNIIQGLSNGIQGMAATFKANLIAWVNKNIPEPIKKLLKIASPSQVMVKFGEMVAQGLADGIENRSSKVTEQTQRLADAIKGAADQMLSDIDRALDITKEEFSLSELQLGEDAGEGSKLSLQLQELNAESDAASKRIEVLTEAHSRSVKATGANSAESQDLAYQLKKEELAQKKIQIQIQNTTAAQNKLSDSSVFLQARLDDLEEEMSNLDIKHSIEQAQLGESANQASQYALEVRQGNEALGLAKERLDLVSAAYEQSRIKTGENSEQTRNLYKELLEAKLSYEDLKSNIADTTDKMNEQINSAEELKDRIVDLSRVNAGLPESGNGSVHLSAVIANSGDIPTPEESGLNNTKIGSDGLTDYTRAIRDALSENINAVPHLATGGFIEKDTMAMLHKNEGVLPLDKLQPMMSNALMDAMQKIGSFMGSFTPAFTGAGTSQPVYLTVNLDGTVISRQLYYLNQGKFRGQGA